MENGLPNGKRVLCIDENPAVLDFLRERITGRYANCQVKTTSDVQEAQDFISRHFYDLIILDISGPEGFRILDLAKRQEASVALLSSRHLTPEEVKKVGRQKGNKNNPPYVLKQDLEQLNSYLDKLIAGQPLTCRQRILLQNGFYF
jgi:CheY-like chemotaxis protein